MKIDFSTETQQTQTELNEKFFSIADPAFIFDLLRNKIYSNPVLAVCRELSCNALDAHREVGKGDVPIQIHLPNRTESYFKVRDFGPGISPSRIDDIYLKYAASTKRDSNDQIGAFGIGAKSPFSYSDSFTIVTNHDGKCYNYMAFIDESRMGKLILLSETETTDPNGTEIIVPVKPHDQLVFHENIEKCTRHWNVKPKFTGVESLNYRNVQPVIGTDNWFISNDRENYYERKIKVLVGETEYNLDGGAVKSFADTSILNATNADVYLRFQVGEISLAANRESVYLDAQTKEAIASRLTELRSGYIQMLRAKISSQPTYWDACSFVNDELYNICNDPPMYLGDIFWNGKKIRSKVSSNSDFSITEFHQKQVRGWSSNETKIVRRLINYISASKKSRIVIHDCGVSDATSRHLKPFFSENNQISTYYVIHPTNCDKQDFNLQSFLEVNGFSDLGYELLSKHNKQIRSKKSSEKTKMTLFRLNASEGAFGSIALAEVQKDTNKKIFVHLRKDTFRNRRHPVDSQKNPIETSKLALLLSMDSTISVYGVDENIEEDRFLSMFMGSSMAEDYMNDWVSSIDREKWLDAMWVQDQVSKIDSNMRKLAQLNVRDMIVSETSPMRSLLLYCEEVSAKYSSYRNFYKTLSAFGKGYVTQEDDMEFLQFCKTKDNLHDILAAVKEKYPMLDLLDNYKTHSNYSVIAGYINMVDGIS